MSISEILDSQLCPDIANIIFDYNMPRKKDIDFLKLKTTLDIETKFRDYKIGGIFIKKKHMDVLIENKRTLYKQHSLFDDLMHEFYALLEAFINADSIMLLPFEYRGCKIIRSIGIFGTDMIIEKKGDENIEIYEYGKLHPRSNIIEKLFKIYLKNIAPTFYDDEDDDEDDDY